MMVRQNGAVLETLRGVQTDGAKVVWIGSDQDSYGAIGFENKFQRKL